MANVWDYSSGRSSSRMRDRDRSPANSQSRKPPSSPRTASAAAAAAAAQAAAARPRKPKYYYHDDDVDRRDAAGLLDDDPRLAQPSARRNKPRSRSRYNNSNSNNNNNNNNTSNDDDESADEDMYRHLRRAATQPYGRYYLSADDDDDEEDEEWPALRRARTSGGVRSPKGYAAAADALGVGSESEKERGRRYSAQMLKAEQEAAAAARSRSKKYRRKPMPPVMDTDDDEDEDDDHDHDHDHDEDDVLAYGVGGYYGYYPPPPRRHRSASRGSAPGNNKPSRNIYYVDDDDDDSDGSPPDYFHRPPRRRSRSRSASRSRQNSNRDDPPPTTTPHYDTAAALAAAASSARSQADYDKYVRQLRKLDPKARSRSQSRSRQRSKSVSGVIPTPPPPDLDDDWAEIPECERPDFVPPPPPHQQHHHHHHDPTPVSVVHPAAQTSWSGGIGMYASQPPAPSPSTPTTPGAAPNMYYQPHPSSAYGQPGQHPRRQSQQVPPPPPPPPAPPAPPHPGAAQPPPPPNQGMQYPSVPRPQYMQQQYAHPQQPMAPEAAPYSHHPQAAAASQNRVATTGPPPSPQRQYASPAPFQYAQVDPDLRYTPNPAKPSLPSESKFSAKAANPAATSATQLPDLSHILESKPRRRRPSASGRRSMSFPTPPSREQQMNVPGSFPEPAPPPPGSPLVEPYQGAAQQQQQQQQQQKASGSTTRWPNTFAKYFTSNDDEKAPPPSEPKRSNSKANKKKNRASAAATERDKDKLDKWVKLNRNTDSLESISMTSSSKQTQEYVYDPVPDAKALKAALTAPNRADAKPLITLLPYLTSDEMHALRTEYRKTMRINGRAVNLAKHIGSRVSGSFGKACHSTALAQWESEAYWVILHRDNPQRKELLIETLVGRSDAEIDKIKASFRENYSQDLEKFVKTELKPDKFRMAMLVALAEPRMPDNAAIEPELVREDVRALRRAMVDGAEMDMLQIILVRGYTHLREVLHVYKSAFRENFAREMINRSRNVVGEILLHIVNGALNRPMRDAILLHQAIAETEPGRDRAELLISRLIRLHWSPHHLERVKAEYRARYGREVERAIREEILAPNAAASASNGGGGGGGGGNATPSAGGGAGNAAAAAAGGTGGGARNTDWVEFCIELVKSSSFHAGPDEDEDDDVRGGGGGGVDVDSFAS